MTDALNERIEINSDVMLGKPVIRETRIPVEITCVNLVKVPPKPTYLKPIHV